MREILNACILYVCLSKGIWLKIYAVPCNMWPGIISAKDRSEDLTAIFAKNDHVISARYLSSSSSWLVGTPPTCLLHLQWICSLLPARNLWLWFSTVFLFSVSLFIRPICLIPCVNQKWKSQLPFPYYSHDFLANFNAACVCICVYTLIPISCICTCTYC